jgi:hypothetical protein
MESVFAVACKILGLDRNFHLMTDSKYLCLSISFISEKRGGLQWPHGAYILFENKCFLIVLCLDNLESLFEEKTT